MSATATIPDLWPEDFGVKDKQPLPSAILRQQGYRLGERTRDAVFGEVESTQESPGRFLHTLWLSAPYLKVRQYALLVRHGLEGYPAEVSLLDGNGHHLRKETAHSADEFMTYVREMLAAPHIVQLIGSLISQARDLDDE
jgi:hypothetical protein